MRRSFVLNHGFSVNSSISSPFSSHQQLSFFPPPSIFTAPLFVRLPSGLLSATSAALEITCGKQAVAENTPVGGPCRRFIILPLTRAQCLSASCHLTPTEEPGGLLQGRGHSRAWCPTDVVLTFLFSCGRSGFFFYAETSWTQKPEFVYEAS